ncbi:MAG TPA: helix-turn-helix domain-containing protein [Acidimicrobiales bacterium]|nr:helix-turn-helix domain-containing protein [Acidimicrobiales bacterium]
MIDAGDRPRRLTRAEAKTRTRERVLDAAALVFARKGFAGASVEEIAESAGYSTGALYSNFESKEQLFLELLSVRRARGISRRVTAVAEILDEELVVDEDPFAALGRLFVKVAGRNTELAPLQAEFWLYAVRNPEAMGLIAAKLGEELEALEPLVARALRRLGAAPQIPARAVTTVVLAVFQGLVHQRRVDAASVPDDLFAQALRWLIAGLCSETPMQADEKPDGA